MAFLVYILLAYLFGSIPWGYLVARWRKINIRKKGSGSIGATNVYRTMGLSYGALVGVLDVLKGVIVMIIAKFSLNNEYEIALIALAVILGHTFSIFLKGKGGKGVATTFGVAIVLMGWKVALIIVAIWLLLLMLTRLMSLTNLILIWIFPSYFFFIEPNLAYFILGIIVTLLIYWEHRENIDRLKEGNELQLDIKIVMKTENKKKVMPVPSKVEKVSKTKKVNSKTARKSPKKRA